MLGYIKHHAQLSINEFKVKNKHDTKLITYFYDNTNVNHRCSVFFS